MLFVGEDGFHGHSDGRLQSARLLYHVAVHELPRSEARVRIGSKLVPRPPPRTVQRVRYQRCCSKRVAMHTETESIYTFQSGVAVVSVNELDSYYPSHRSSD